MIVEGKFPCKTCKKEVKTIRVYTSTGMASWMCSEKHLSEVQLYKVGYKKVKRDE
jgi:hypothetical protein